MRTLLIPLFVAATLMAFSTGCKKADPSTESGRSVKPGGGEAASPASASAGVKKGVVLKAKWAVGNRYTYRMDLDQHSTNRIPQAPTPIRQDVTMAMTYALSVVKEVGDGGREIELEFLANEMEMKMGEQVMLSFDSKENPKDGAENAALAPFRKMIGSKLRLELNREGKVQGVSGMDEWLKNVMGGAEGNPMLSQQFNEGFFRQLADLARGLPNQPVTVGETWPLKGDVAAGNNGKINIDAKVTLKGWEDRDQHHCAILDSKGTLTGSLGNPTGPIQKMSIDQGKVSSRSWFDPELGAMIDSESHQAFRVKGEFPGQPGANQPKAQFTSELGQKVSVKLVELSKVNT